MDGVHDVRKSAPLMASLALTLLAATGCGGGEGGKGDESGGAARRSASPGASQKSCPADGALKVTEQGFSKLPDDSDDDLRAVSYGALVENASRPRTHVNAGVKVTFLDASGHPLAINGVESNGAGSSFTLGVVASGGKRAVSGQELLGEWPATMKVEPTWTCLGDKVPADIGVTDSRLSLHGDDLTADLSVLSSAGTTTRGLPVFVFRDAGHHIVGGGPFLGVSGNAKTLTLPAGSSKQHVTVDAGGFVPQEADLDATTVYVQPQPG